MTFLVDPRSWKSLPAPLGTTRTRDICSRSRGSANERSGSLAAAPMRSGAIEQGQLAVFAPVLVEPLDLFGSELGRKWLVVKSGVLGIFGQFRGDVDPEFVGIYREQAVVEEPMDVPA